MFLDRCRAAAANTLPIRADSPWPRHRAQINSPSLPLGVHPEGFWP
jgi:hypothetical protein